MLAPKDRLIIALDVPARSKAMGLVEQTSDLVGMYKIGSQLFTAEGPRLVQEIIQRGKKVFLDLKFHDIPNIVAKAGMEAARLGVSMFTVHAFGGEPMLRQVVEDVGTFCDKENLTKPLIVGVTLLTSLEPKDLERLCIHETPESLVPRLAELAFSCGLDGVVSSAHEVALIRRQVNKPQFVIVVPGIRLEGAEDRDQKRVGRPEQALRDGATYLVVGRPVTESENPRHAAETILNIMAALSS